MIKVVWKFPLTITDEQAVAMPKGAKLLKFWMQDGAPTIWALVDPLAPVELRRFRFAGTGHPIDDEDGRHQFVGTTFQGPFVWHLFEVLVETPEEPTQVSS